MVETAGGTDGYAVATSNAGRLPAGDKAGILVFLKTNYLCGTDGGADAVSVAGLSIDLK
jgi:hypothetical protein